MKSFELVTSAATVSGIATKLKKDTSVGVDAGSTPSRVGVSREGNSHEDVEPWEVIRLRRHFAHSHRA